MTTRADHSSTARTLARSTAVNRWASAQVHGEARLALAMARRGTQNLLFVYRLGQAVGLAKAELRDRVRTKRATEEEAEKLALFRYGAFAFALVYTAST